MSEGSHGHAVRALADDNATAIDELRRVHIPQRVGMAAACRALAEDLPRALAQQVEADLANGHLAERWARAKAAAAAHSGDPDPLLTAAVALLRQHGRATARHLRVRGQEWTAAAHRLEGQADALEAQNERLAQIVATAPSSSPPPASAATALLSAGSDAATTHEALES